jgi:hypothetical protein
MAGKHAATNDADMDPEIALGAKSEISFEAEEVGVCLAVTVNNAPNRYVVLQARHTGSRNPPEKRVLDRLCQIIVGRPLQEAADHGIIYACAALPDDCAPVEGIRTPQNAGPSFVMAERLIRKIHEQARVHFMIGHRDNGWYVRPSSAWLQLDEAEQADRIRPIIAAFLRGKGMAEGVIFITRIERGTRITIAFENVVSYMMKPRLMMELEQHIRREAGDPLELFMEEKKDANKIRRL